MAGTPLAGTNGRITISGTALNQAKWSVRPKGNLLPSTNFESVGTDGNTYFEGVFGVRECDVTFSGFWDAGANPHTTFGLESGDIITAVRIFPQKSRSSSFYSFPEFLVIDVSVDDDVNGMLMISVTGKANGEFYYPS